MKEKLFNLTLSESQMELIHSALENIADPNNEEEYNKISILIGLFDRALITDEDEDGVMDYRTL